jgi:hypothetical protein
MGQQPVRPKARSSALDTQAVLRKDRADRECWLEPSGGRRADALPEPGLVGDAVRALYSRN